jgi:uncharacterized protein YidB (DUF937 family)
MLMAGLEDTISSVPGGNIGKPLLLGLLALLASGALFRKSDAEPSAKQEKQQTSDEESGGLLGGLGGLLDKLQKGGLGNATNSWVGLRSKSTCFSRTTWLCPRPRHHQDDRSTVRPVRRGNHQAVVQVLPGVVDKLTPKGRIPTMAELSEMR